MGFQRQIGSDMVVTADYYYKDIKHITTIRSTNLAFEARMPGFANELDPGTGNFRIESYGPWGSGTYNGFTLGFQKRMTHNFTVQASYTFAHAYDDVLNSTLASEIQNGEGVNILPIAGLSDSYVGKVPAVTDANTGQTNASGPFINSEGNFVPKAGTFYNGAKIDYGPSDLTLNQTFLIHTIVQLPWKIELAGIFGHRAVSITVLLLLTEEPTSTEMVCSTAKAFTIRDWGIPFTHGILRRRRLSSIWICAFRNVSTLESV